MSEPSAFGETAVSPRKLLMGCWRQASYSAGQIADDDKEWGSRTWCFEPRGKMTSTNFVCSRNGGCDGWDGAWKYRWRGNQLEIRDWAYDENGPDKPVWRRCQLLFTAADQVVLKNCYFSSREWIRQVPEKAPQTRQ
jgi:hypothetical protein